MKFSRISLILTLLTALPALAQDKWIRLTSAHFEMYSAVDEKKSREAILYFERVRDFFSQASPLRNPGGFPVRIVVFPNAQTMRIYAPNQAVGAFFAAGPLRDSIVMKNLDPDTYPMSIHEYFHLLVRHSGLHIPLWLDEGWADVYSTMKPVKDGVAVGDLIPRYLPWLAQAQWYTIPELASVNAHSPDYNESTRVGMFYAESWALTHMLYLSPDYKSSFGKFVSALNHGNSLDQSLFSAYNKTALQVLADMQGYLLKKKLYGVVFQAPFEKSTDNPVVTPVMPYDAALELADLHAASLHLAAANRAYQQLQTDAPTRPEAFGGAGYLALQTGDKATARREFTKAFERGTSDAQLCVQLATLDREAKQPASTVMAELSRAMEIKPDFGEAVFQLALMKLDARDFEASFTLLSRVGIVAPDRMGVFRSALAYSNLQRGNVTAARTDAAAASRAAKTPAEKDSADRLIALIEARSKGPAAVLPGETLVRREGTALALRCAAPGTNAMSKLGVIVDGKQLALDLPDASAVEITRSPAGARIELKCGALPPFPLVVEYAPASVANVQSSGIIRRLEF